MKRVFLALIVLLFLLETFPHAQVRESKSTDKRGKRVEWRVRPFTDLYFFVYKRSNPAAEKVDIEGFSQAVAAAREVSLYSTSIELVAFQSENSTQAEKAFSQFPETYKLKTGQDIRLREKAVSLAQSLSRIEKPFLETIWPQHKRLIEAALAKVELTLGPKEQECFDYFIRHLGMEKSEFIVPVYLVAEASPGAFTLWGKDEKRGVCVLSVTALQGSELIDAILHESIHALDLETKGEGNVLVELRSRLLKAGFSADDLVVRHGPHMLVFIQSAETVRRHIDATYEPYGEGVFVRPAIAPLLNVERPIWTSYLDGRISRDEALNRMVSAFVKARNDDASRKGGR